jgi:hypothetical protein
MSVRLSSPPLYPSFLQHAWFGVARLKGSRSGSGRQLRLLMNHKNLLLTAALGLIMSAFTVHADIPITALPYTISSPGTYVLTGNLTSPPLQNDQSAIVITGSAGKVVLDLKGFTRHKLQNLPASRFPRCPSASPLLGHMF